MNQLCKVICLSIAFCIGHFSGSIAIASSSHFDKVLTSYFEAAFQNNEVKLRKFEVARELSYTINCQQISETICSGVRHFFDSTTSSKQIFETANNNKSQIDILFAKDSETNDPAFLGLLDFVGGFSDSNDKSCQLHYIVSGNRITKAKLIVSSEQSEKRINACIAVQFFQALGLTLPAGLTFEAFWKLEPLGLSNFDQSQFQKLLRSLSILEFIHMCEILHSGMNKTDVQKNLQFDSKCFEGMGLR
jgi:hypothetical protein